MPAQAPERLVAVFPPPELVGPDRPEDIAQFEIRRHRVVFEIGLVVSVVGVASRPVRSALALFLFALGEIRDDRFPSRDVLVLAQCRIALLRNLLPALDGLGEIAEHEE